MALDNGIGVYARIGHSICEGDAMGTNATDELRAKIKQKKATIGKLKEQESELKRLQAAVAALPKLQADVAALERALGILKGEESSEVDPDVRLSTMELEIKRSIREHSIPGHVYAVLRNAGKPLNGDEILGALAAKGTHVKKLSLYGAIYRAAKQGELFRVVKPGVFGLLEWQQ